MNRIRDERRDENYIPFGINAGGITIKIPRRNQFVTFIKGGDSNTNRRSNATLDRKPLSNITKGYNATSRKGRVVFLYATRRLSLFYISTKYHQNIPKCIRVTERTRILFQTEQIGRLQR